MVYLVFTAITLLLSGCKHIEDLHLGSKINNYNVQQHHANQYGQRQPSYDEHPKSEPVMVVPPRKPTMDEGYYAAPLPHVAIAPSFAECEENCMRQERMRHAVNKNNKYARARN